MAKQKTDLGKAEKPKPINPFTLKNGSYCTSDVLGANGFTVRDGKVYPSPGRTALLKEIHFEEEGVRKLLAATNAFTAEVLARSTKKMDAWWEHVCEDLQLERNTPGLTVNFSTGCLYIVPSEAAAPKKDVK